MQLACQKALGSCACHKCFRMLFAAALRRLIEILNSNPIIIAASTISRIANYTWKFMKVCATILKLGIFNLRDARFIVGGLAIM